MEILKSKRIPLFNDIHLPERKVAFLLRNHGLIQFQNIHRYISPHPTPFLISIGLCECLLTGFFSLFLFLETDGENLCRFCGGRYNQSVAECIYLLCRMYQSGNMQDLEG